MAYARIPDELGTDDRYLEAIDRCSAAGTLVLLGYSYAAREESDGRVPQRQLRRMLDDQAETERAIDALVDVGLWARTDDGVEMLDYLHAGRNMTRAEWHAKRETERIRKARWRDEKRRGSGPDDTPPPVSRRTGLGTPDGTDGGRDAGPTADETQDRRRPSLARERAPAHAQIQNPKGCGGGDARGAGEPVNEEDEVVPLSWSPATKALVTAGLSRDAIAAQAPAIAAELHAESRSIAWPQAGRWLRAKRANGQCQAGPDEPTAALRFMLRARGIPLVGARARRTPGQRDPVGETAPPNGLSDEQTDELWHRIHADARTHIGDDAWDTWLSVIRVVSVTDREVWIACPDHARAWISHRLVPLLSASATRQLDRPMKVRIHAAAAVPA